MNKNDLSDLCLMDKTISLEAKGLYFLITGLMECNEHSLEKVYQLCYENKSFVDSLIIELVDKGYLFLALNNPTSCENPLYIFSLDNENGE